MVSISPHPRERDAHVGHTVCTPFENIVYHRGGTKGDPRETSLPRKGGVVSIKRPVETASGHRASLMQKRATGSVKWMLGCMSRSRTMIGSVHREPSQMITTRRILRWAGISRIDAFIQQMKVAISRAVSHGRISDEDSYLRQKRVWKRGTASRIRYQHPKKVHQQACAPQFQRFRMTPTETPYRHLPSA